MPETIFQDHIFLLVIPRLMLHTDHWYWYRITSDACGMRQDHVSPRILILWHTVFTLKNFDFEFKIIMAATMPVLAPGASLMCYGYGHDITSFENCDTCADDGVWHWDWSMHLVFKTPWHDSMILTLIRTADCKICVPKVRRQRLFPIESCGILHVHNIP